MAVKVDKTAWRFRWIVAHRHFIKRMRKRLALDGSIFEDLNSNVAGYASLTRDEEKHGPENL